MFTHTARLLSNTTAAAAAISRSSFRSTLDQIWCGWEGGAPQRIGLAISGGVDSMALASLYRDFMREKEDEQSMIAFIVDHQLRSNSAQEAQIVKANLESIGIQTKILQFNGPTCQDLASVSHVENNARRKRYAALGDACKQHGINALMVAHHADDQAETFLMRLHGGYVGKGLAGMSTQVNIPTCLGRHRVFESGRPRRLRHQHLQEIDADEQSLLVESGGVRVIRPLLRFTKAECIATCQQAGVEWVEDPTNEDRSLTMRNTIRHLQNKELLPEALRTRRVTALAASTRNALLEVEVEAQAMLQSLDLRLDLRVGEAVCRFPQSVLVSIRKAQNADLIKLGLLRQLVALVTPIDGVQASDLTNAARVFLAENQDCDVLPSAAGVHIVCATGASGELRYRIRRAVPSRRETKRSIRIPLDVTVHEAGIVWSQWLLWDNRYWVRWGHAKDVARDDDHHDEVVIGFWTSQNINHIRQTCTPKQVNGLRDKIKIAPGSLRATLPVIAVSNSSGLQERIVAVPSISWSVADWCRIGDRKDRSPSPSYYYDIRYKKVDDHFTEELEATD